MVHLENTARLGAIVSEVWGEDVIVREVGVKGVWAGDLAGSFVQLQVTTGMGAEVGGNQIRDEWDELVPVRWEGGRGALVLRNNVDDWHFSVGRRFEGYGRRFGVWAMLTGATEVWVYVWVTIEE